MQQSNGSAKHLPEAAQNGLALASHQAGQHILVAVDANTFLPWLRGTAS